MYTMAQGIFTIFAIYDKIPFISLDLKYYLRIDITRQMVAVGCLFLHSDYWILTFNMLFINIV